jgi:tripartite-type tricarboxylate transporter receptor subunit TctC
MLASPGHCGNHRILRGHHGNRSADAHSSSARTITLVVVPFPAGGPTDTIGRIIAEGLQSSLGQPFNHRKRAGGDRQRPDRQGCARGGRRAHADPGTIATHVFNGAAYPLKYDVVPDFEPIALIAFDPQIIVVRKELPVADFAQLIAWLKANPDKATAGTAGVGSTSHVSAVFSTGITRRADNT